MTNYKNAKELIKNDPIQANKILQKIVINEKLKIPFKNLIGKFGWEDGRNEITESNIYFTDIGTPLYEIRFKRIDSWGNGRFFPCSNHKKDMESAIKELKRLKKIANQQVQILEKYHFNN